jgi:hypothetical protein
MQPILWQSITQATGSKRILFVQELDFDLANLQVIYWLAKDGGRLDGPDQRGAH